MKDKLLSWKWKLAAGLLIGVILALVLLMPRSSRAGDKYWVDTPELLRLWSNDISWSQFPNGPGWAGVPGEGDDVYLYRGVDTDQSVWYCLPTSYTPDNPPLLNSLNINATGSGMMSLDMGYIWVLKANTVSIGYNGKGTLNQSDSSILYNVNLYLGSGSTNSSYNMKNNSVLYSGSGWLSPNNPEVGGNQYIGNSGIGTFNQSDSSVNYNINLYVGNGSTANGLYNLNDSAVLYSGDYNSAPSARVGGNQFIGHSGLGTLNQLGFSQNYNINLYLGYETGGIGNYNLGENSTLYSGSHWQFGGNNIGGNQYIGYSGTGTFNQSGNSENYATNIYIAYNPGSHGTYNLEGGTIYADSIIVGNGGVFKQIGGRLYVANFINNGTFSIKDGNSSVSGDVINPEGAQINVTNANVTWDGTFTNNGAYISDPALQTFINLKVNPSGYIAAASQDTFIISGDFQNQSQNTLWNTLAARLSFITNPNSGSTDHNFYIPGADNGPSATNAFAWGTLDLTGQTLHLFDGDAVSGGALYVNSILGVSFTDLLVNNILMGQDGLNLNIYYDPNTPDDKYLGGLTYDLAGGGKLIPTPVPDSVLLLSSGLLGLAGWRRLRRG